MPEEKTPAAKLDTLAAMVSGLSLGLMLGAIICGEYERRADDVLELLDRWEGIGDGSVSAASVRARLRGA